MKKNIKDYINFDCHTDNVWEIENYLYDNFIDVYGGDWITSHKYITINYPYAFNSISLSNHEGGEYIPPEEFKKLIGMTAKEDNIIKTPTRQDVDDKLNEFCDKLSKLMSDKSKWRLVNKVGGDKELQLLGSNCVIKHLEGAGFNFNLVDRLSDLAESKGLHSSAQKLMEDLEEDEINLRDYNNLSELISELGD